MQINSPSLSSLTPRPLQRPANPVLSKPPTEPATTPPLGGPSQQPISIATILEHWGTSNAIADLNTDGIVDAQDLALAQTQENTGNNAINSGWGQSGATDINGDGTTDANDLALMLSGPHTEPPSRAAVVESLVQAAFEARDGDGSNTISASDFKDDGRMFAHLNLDRSGEIGREELTKALNSQFDRFHERFPDANPHSFAKRWLEALTGHRGAPNMANYDRVNELFSKGSGESRRPNSLLSARA